MVQCLIKHMYMVIVGYLVKHSDYFAFTFTFLPEWIGIVCSIVQFCDQNKFLFLKSMHIFFLISDTHVFPLRFVLPLSIYILTVLSSRCVKKLKGKNHV